MLWAFASVIKTEHDPHECGMVNCRWHDLCRNDIFGLKITIGTSKERVLSRWPLHSFASYQMLSTPWWFWNCCLGYSADNIFLNTTEDIMESEEPDTELESFKHHCSKNFFGIQGRPQLRLQKSYQFQVPKTNPKTSPLYLLVSIMAIFPFPLLCWWKRSRSKACNRGASRLGEAWPRPRLGRKTYWHKDKARLTGTRNYIILLLKSQQGWTWSSWWLCCLAGSDAFEVFWCFLRFCFRLLFPIRFEVLNRLMRFFEVLVSKASAILFPVLRLVGNSAHYNIILKVTQCPRLLGTNQWPHTNSLEF